MLEIVPLHTPEDFQILFFHCKIVTALYSAERLIEFASKFRNPSGIMKAAGTLRTLAPGVTNPYFLAGAAAVVPPSVAMYQLNQARKRGELLDPVDNPYETEFGVLTQEDLQPEIGRQNVDEITKYRNLEMEPFVKL